MSVSGPDLAASCQAVTKLYTAASSEVHALHDVDASFPSGKLTVVAGPSGSGKSSLLRLLACMDRPDQGEVVVAGNTVSALKERTRRLIRRRLVGYVFQQPSDNLLPYLSAEQHLSTAIRLRGQTSSGDGGMLEALGLGHRRHHRPAQMSGGEQQRLAVAFAAVGDPTVVIADEPTAELDAKGGLRVLAALLFLRARGIGVIASSHDPAVIDSADQVIWLDHGVVVRA